MVDPTIGEQIGAWIGLLVIFLFFALIIVGVSLRAMRIGRRMTTPPTFNAEIDARILMADNLYVNADPLHPEAEYGAVNEARQRRTKGR